MTWRHVGHVHVVFLLRLRHCSRASQQQQQQRVPLRISRQHLRKNTSSPHSRSVLAAPAAASSDFQPLDSSATTSSSSNVSSSSGPVDTRKKVVVVGGGWAGFGAAKHLSEQGYAVTLIEAAKNPGGLSGGFRTSSGKVVEAGEGPAGKPGNSNCSTASFSSTVGAAQTHVVGWQLPYQMMGHEAVLCTSHMCSGMR